MSDDKRFIEESFPVKEVSKEAAREKSIRHGHISTLHIWWARRPLASSRATNYAALIPAPKTLDEWNKKRNFIIEFSKWENSLNPSMIEKARRNILDSNEGKPPKVLDPFSGGGAIPLEALRLGCETYANEYNPVAVLILKCVLEYPQKYGKPGEVKKETDEFGKKIKKKIRVENKLLDDVNKWADWVLKEAKKEIGKFYLQDEDGSIPVGYIWARTIPCQNPSCGAEIPLMRQFWMAKKKNKKIALLPYIQNKEVEFKVVGDSHEKMPDEFDPSNGTVSRAVATCPVCGSMVDAKTTRRLFQEGKSGERMIAVVLHKPGTRGKRYRIATKEDVESYKKAEEYLRKKQESLMIKWGIDPVPDELLPLVGTLGFRIQRYNMKKWGDLFNARQKLSLITFVEKVREAHKKMLAEGYGEEYARAIISYLGLAINRLASYDTTNAPWHVTGEKATQIFGRQALPMVWDYVETNPFADSFSWKIQIDWIKRCINNFSKIGIKPATCNQSSATLLSYEENYFDAIFTDPPYYDNVPYSYLSDFFYVWLKRTLGHLYPELFSTPLTPKKNEIVAYSNGPGGFEEGKRFFEDMLKKSFQEINRVLKPDGIAVIVYAHKSTAGWETLVNSLLDSGLVMTGAWPINTEMKARLRAKESAALASSIYLIARKMKRESTGFYNEVKGKLENHLNKKLDRLWKEGVSGADFFVSAIGFSMEIFGKYKEVLNYEGNPIRADRILKDVRKISTNYAVQKILHDGFSGEISDLTRFYVLYRWNYGEAKVHFDEARKLAQSCSIDLTREWGEKRFIKKQKEYIKVLGPHERRLEDIKKSSELIDILHGVLLLWEKSKHDKMKSLLQESGFGKSDSFYRVAQAVSETLISENKEKKLLDGFLAGRERLINEIKKEEQGRLF